MAEIKWFRQSTYVKKYVAFDGREFDTMTQCDDYEKRKRGDRVTCSLCNGQGHISDGWHQVLNELTYQYEDVEYTHPCPKCKGKGYLDRAEVWE